MMRHAHCLFANMVSEKNPKIETYIYSIRDHKVMLDHDLAALYGVKTKALNQAVQRNCDRFPSDFMFQLTEIERENLSRSQIVTAVRHNAKVKFRLFHPNGKLAFHYK